MRAVFKYGITIDDFFILDIPKGAEVLTVQMQRGSPYIWCLVDPSAELEERVFRLAGTGHPITEDRGAKYLYIGSFQLRNEVLILHLFELKKGGG